MSRAGRRERVVAFAPGRVNLIGEHTDYNGGLALPFAIQAGVRVEARRRADATFRAHALDLAESDAFTAERGLTPSGGETGWRAFVRGVVAELGAAAMPVPDGAELWVAGTIAQGSGLSSSAALACALCWALLGLEGAEGQDPLALARLCSRVENDWVGAPTGLLDQTASLLGREGHALRIDFRDLAVTEVPLRTAGWTLVTVDSGEEHANASGGYAERRGECDAARDRLGVEHLADATLAAVAELPEPLRARARHVLTEDARVDATVDALRQDDLPRVAELLDASHASLRDDFAASTAAVERTVDALRAAGAAGARMVGGGFGGHVLGLLPPGVAAPEGATVVTPGPGAHLRPPG